MKTETDKMREEIIKKIQDLITDARSDRLASGAADGKAHRSERETALWDAVKIVEGYE